MSSLTLYDPFERMQFGGDTCFLCGAPTGPADALPVFPDWLMQHYGFADQQLLLLDKSVISFRDLTLPACPACRSQHLQPLEQSMQRAHGQGAAGFRNLPQRDIFLWLAKMFYGILVRELLNEQNPLIRPEHAVGENPKMFLKFQSLSKLLQALRVPVEFDDFTPYSLFILEQNDTPDEPAFAYRDELNTMMFSLKMGKVTLVCHLLDNGVLSKALRPVWEVVADKALHPVQVAEFSARAYYAAYLFNLIPEFFHRKANPGDHFLTYDSLVDDITMPVFNPWDNQAYAKMLEEMWKKWGIGREQILSGSGQPLSYIFDEEGRFREQPDLA
ncbi:MAG: hypothetical protein ACO1NZ_04905 [Adhaeribacter sp.]